MPAVAHNCIWTMYVSILRCAALPACLPALFNFLASFIHPSLPRPQ